MAGSYPNVPSRRMAPDADGTVLTHRLNNSGPLADQSAATKVELTDEDNVGSISTGSSNNTSYLHWIFPELREFDGGFQAGTGSGSLNFTTLETSGDTTNGIDGTFTTQTVDLPNHFSVYDLYRDNIISYAVSNVRCVKIALNGGGSGGAKTWLGSHLYGEISAGETPDRLLFIDELTGLEFALAQDFGDVPRGSSEDIEWRIRNNSATLTANTVQYTAEDLYLGSASWYTYTLPAGATYAATQQVASIAPVTTTGLIKLRRITDAAETTGLHAGRTYLNTASWS